METILWYIAIPSTLVYLLMAVMTFFGGDLEADIDTDFDSDTDSNSTLQVFTFRNLLSFLVGLSWGSLIGLTEVHLSQPLSILMGIFIGLILTSLQMVLFYFITKFEQKQEPSLETALNKQGTCYLSIPGENKGIGKVNVLVNGSLRTLSASTEGETISTGSRIKVISIDNGLLKVIRI